MHLDNHLAPDAFCSESVEDADHSHFDDVCLRALDRGIDGIPLGKAENIRSKMILQVHDELNFSVYPDEREQVERIVIEEMENAYPLNVPLVADAGWGKNWLEAH